MNDISNLQGLPGRNGHQARGRLVKKKIRMMLGAVVRTVRGRKNRAIHPDEQVLKKGLKPGG